MFGRILCRRWDDLDSFLGRYDADRTGAARQDASCAALALPALDSDRFQLGVGKLLQCLHRRTRSEFDVELERVRSQVRSLNAELFLSTTC